MIDLIRDETYYLRGKFVEWVRVGRGYIETDEQGNQISHSYTNASVRGDIGYIRLWPGHKPPPLPGAPPKRPQQDE
ncbi:MAG: hypothetical protein JO150_13900 [Acidobacteriaceae bacterium]|nr:hypothetical protein [Acidobacteriaceae bacterium]